MWNFSIEDALRYILVIPLNISFGLSLSRAEKNTAETALITRETQATMTEMFNFLKSVYNMLPLQISDKMNKYQPIFFEDALGRSIELPREFCVSKEVC